jgi:hypothetical protein
MEFRGSTGEIETGKPAGLEHGGMSASVAASMLSVRFGPAATWQWLQAWLQR